MAFFPVSEARRKARSSALVLPLALLAASAACLWNSMGFVGLSPGRRIARAKPSPFASRPNLGRIQMLQAAQDITVNDDVTAMHPEDENWYPGFISKVNGDGTYEVTWDDPEEGDPTTTVDSESVQKLKIFKDYKKGDYVLAVFPDDGNRYTGEVLKGNKDGTFQVKWEDPDGGPADSPVKPKDMKKLPPIFTGYKEGDVVEAAYPEDGGMYAATVLAANKDGTFKVKWEDPDGGPEESDGIGPKEMRFPPIPIDQLEIGQKHKGYVKSIRAFGAFIDIGAEGEGLLHISKITSERITEDQISDYIPEGEEIEVWISDIKDDGKFGLTMKEGDTGGPGPRKDVDLSPFADIHPDEVVQAEVMGVQSYGAFCEITLETGEVAQGLLHVSRLGEDFVDNIHDIIAVGDKLEVNIENVDLQSGRVSLRKVGVQGSGGGGGGGARPIADVSKFADIPSDQWLKATVTGVESFGAFVTVKHPDDGSEAGALVHITEIKNGFVENINDEVQMGQEVDVWLKSVDSQANRIAASMKVPGEEEEGGGSRPRVDVSKFADVPSDQWLKATVRRIQSFGVFVSVKHPEDESEADALVHITEIKNGFVENIEDEVEVGQEVDVWLVNVNTETNQISASMKVPGEEEEGGGSSQEQDVSIFADVPSDQWLKATVSSIQSFGAFVKVKHPDGEAEADALVHITEIKNGFVENVEDELEVGQEVDVWLKEVDTDRNKIGASMKVPGEEEEGSEE